MAIICFDLGTKCGFAYKCEPYSKVVSGVISFKTDRFSGGGMVFLSFRNWLNQLKKRLNNNIIEVYFEEVRAHKGVDAAHKYGGFVAHLTAWCERHNIPYKGVGVGAIKKHITGKGNASKKEVIQSVIRAGYNPSDDNEADAIALLSYVLLLNEVNAN